MDAHWPNPLEGPTLRALFDHERERELTVGVEEELMVLDAATLDLLPRSLELLRPQPGDVRFKTELPASQLEIATDYYTELDDLASGLWDDRRSLAARVGAAARLGAAGVHPFAAPVGELSSEDRYERTRVEYGVIARQQLIFGLHVHLGLAGSERVLAVYNELRSYLPELAALAANSPVHAGEDTGMASIRPIISGMLPRQGVPPALGSWEELAAELAWGRRGNRLTRPGEWWWELRPNIRLGTLEVRVPDAQTTVADSVAITCIVVALAVWLARLHDESGLPEPAEAWRINENRWSAARYGVEGKFVDLRTGRLENTRDRLHRLIAEWSLAVPGLRGSPHVKRAHALVEANGALRQRQIMRSVGSRGLTAWLAEQFLEPVPGLAPRSLPPS
ncbi:MAG: YbdK family carboxylate-amine ligase [Actinomycetota bacterium]|nr:YbdK family carboxylate-amine ligase [Actinomycetota bacterium]